MNQMNQIDMDVVKQQLRHFAESYQQRLRKFAMLMPLKDEILALAQKGATSGEIASVLAQHQLAVSKDTVNRFLREHMKKERTPRAKKSGAEAQTNGSQSAGAKPVLMPRGLTAPANQ